MNIIVDEAVTDEIIISQYTEIFTTGHPRSGNSWIGRLLSDLLSCPWQENPGQPTAFYGTHNTGRFVIRKRHSIEKLSGLTVFIYRDPRDVCVSRHFYNHHPDIQTTIEAMYLPDEKELDNQGPYEKFMRELWEHPEKYTVSLTYEDLHENPIPALGRVVKELVGTALTDDYIRESYERQTFDSFLERYPQAKGSMRKGIVGDWRNHFKRDDGRLFQKYFGKLMFDQGYIEDGDWWEELPT